ncbi:hypothetical protein ACQPW3_13395 [Actinosynnema sp. CA-248983]
MDFTELPAVVEIDNACLAYAIWYWEGSGDDHGADSSSSGDGLALYWAYSEELCAQDRCAYCYQWNPPAADVKVCPGVHEHARHAFGRASAHPDLRWCYLEFGAFPVPFDLTRGDLVIEIERQIRTGFRYAVAERE